MTPFYDLSDHLEQRHGIHLRPGGRAACPFCGKNTFTMKCDGSVAKCWHGGCGKYITQHGVSQGYDNSFAQVLDQFRRVCHQHLVGQLNSGIGYAANYLTKCRHIHHKVLRDLPDVGVVPANCDMNDLFQPALDAHDKLIAELQMKLTESQQRRLEEKEKRKQDHKEGKQQSLPTAKGKTEHEKQWESEMVKLLDHKRWMVEQRDVLRERLSQTEGWIAFFHSDHSHRVRSIRFRKASTQEKKFQHWHPHKPRSPVPGKHGTSNTGVVGNALFSTYAGEDKKDLNRLVVVEGEINLLILHSLAVHTAAREEGENDSGSSYANWIVATGSSSTVDIDVLVNLLNTPDASHPMVVLQDADDAGDAMVTKIAEATAVDVASPFSRGQDIDEVIRSYNGEWQRASKAVFEIIKKRRKQLRPYEAVAAQISGIRHKEESDNRQAFEISDHVWRVILQDLLERGEFYQDGLNCYYFLNEEKKLIALSDEDNELSCLLARYGLNRSEKIYEYMQEELFVQARTKGEFTTVYLFAHFDRMTYTLYVSNNASGIYRITSDRIDLVNNGTDGVMFLHDRRWTTYKPIFEQDSEDLFDEFVLKKINLTQSGDLTVKDQRTSVELWFYATFFREIFPTKPLIAFIGPKGSGKSFTLRKLGLLLFGANFQVESLPSKEEAFDTIVTNAHLACFDNADSKVEWLPDRLAICATGGQITKRILYTTNQQASFQIRCWVGLTSRTPHFRRDDVADRLLVNFVHRLEEEGFLGESSLCAEILDNRDRIMGSVFRHLQRVIAALQKTDSKEYKTSFRIADFGSFALRIGDANGIREKTKEFLSRLRVEQSAFSLDGDSLVDLIRHLLETPGYKAEAMTAHKLFKLFVDLASHHDLAMPYKSARSLGQRLYHAEAELKTVFEMKVTTDNHSKIKLFKFRKRENAGNEVDEDLLAIV